MSKVVLTVLGLSFVVSLFSFGCANPNTRLLDDKTYPVEWPSIELTLENSNFLNGIYLNEGILIHGNESESVLLSEILIGRKDIKSDHVSLQVLSPPRRLSKIILSFDEKDAEKHALPYTCAWSKNVLVCAGDQTALSLAPVGMVAAGDTFYLARGEDGSLILKIEQKVAGLVVVVPVFSEEGSWARFLPDVVQE